MKKLIPYGPKLGVASALETDTTETVLPGDNIHLFSFDKL
jgi:hypothetical protein